MLTKILFYIELCFYQTQGSRYQPESQTNKLILYAKKYRPNQKYEHFCKELVRKNRRFLRAWYVKTVRGSGFPFWNTIGTYARNIVLDLWHSSTKTASSRRL